MSASDFGRRLTTLLPHSERSERCPYQALRVTGTRIWATQFHPELDQAANLHRYRAYIDRYDPDGDEGDFRSLPSPETSRLLPRFLELIR